MQHSDWDGIDLMDIERLLVAFPIDSEADFFIYNAAESTFKLVVQLREKQLKESRKNVAFLLQKQTSGGSAS